MDFYRLDFFYYLMSLQPERYLLVYCSMYNKFFMDLPVSSFVFHSSLLTAKSIDLMVPPHDGFLEIACIFVVATLITDVLLK